LNFAIGKLSTMPFPRTLLLYSDGQDSFEIEPINKRIHEAQLCVIVKEAIKSEEVTLLHKLTLATGGHYQRI
jgi:hypothetical protein